MEGKPDLVGRVRRGEKRGKEEGKERNGGKIGFGGKGGRRRERE